MGSIDLFKRQIMSCFHRIGVGLGTRSRSFAAVICLAFGTNVMHSQAGNAVHAEPSKSTHSFSRINGVVFTQGVHGPLLADLFLPEATGLKPGVVYLHGGAWKSGDLTQLQDVATFLADKGYVGMAIDYDLTNRGDQFPVALRQSERAVSWLRENSVRYGVDPQRIAVIGSSAGGELAALLALDSASLPSAKVQAAVIFNGVLDLSYVGPDSEDMVAPYLGGSCADKPKMCKESSPVEQVHAGAPPFFVGHGTADRIVPFRQADTFVKRLKEAHVPVTPFIAQDAGHTYWRAKAWFDPNLAAVLAFLQMAIPER